MQIQFILALIIGLFVGGTTGYIGSLMVTKRMALMGGALGHLTLPGVALALLYGFDVSLGAILFLSFGIFLIWSLEQKTKLPTEALTAVIFATSLAIAFLFLPKNKTSQALLGDISKVCVTATAITILTASLIFLIINKTYSKLVLMSISKDLAISEKVNVKKYDLIYLTCIALMIALGVRIVGGLMTAALVAIPACTSKNISKNLFQYSFISLIVGAVSCLSGIILSEITKINSGPLIIISSSTIFLLSLFFKKS